MNGTGQWTIVEARGQIVWCHVVPGKFGFYSEGDGKLLEATK